MKIISIVSQKGGAGKSTLTRHLAVESHRQGQKTAAIDLDPPQYTLSKWAERREAPEPFILKVGEQDLPEAIHACREDEIDHLYLDTPPRVETAASTSAAVSDVLVLPTEPTAEGIEAIGDSLAIAHALNKTSAIVLNKGRHNSPINKEAKDKISDYIHTYPRTIICPHIIMHRAPIADSSFSGRTAQELPPSVASQAAAEIQSVWNWIIKKLNS